MQCWSRIPQRTLVFGTLVGLVAALTVPSGAAYAVDDDLTDQPASGSPGAIVPLDAWEREALEASGSDLGSFSALSEPEANTFSASSVGKAQLPGPAPIVARGGGWGHGIGMSQYGAQSMAVAGRSYAQILTHYHVNTAVRANAVPTDFRVGLRSTGGTSGGTLHFASMPVEAVNRNIVWSACTSAYSGCTELETQPAGETWISGRANGLLVLRNADSSVRHDLGVNHLRAQLGSGSTDAQVKLSAKGNRIYRWGALEVRHSSGQTGVRATIDFSGQFERYVYGIAEVPFGWHTEALRAQAVAARSYAVARSLNDTCNCYVTDGTENQVYYGAARELGANGNRWRDAVDATAGRALTYNGRPIVTFYASSHHKRSENIEDVWSTPQPYHRSVSDPWSSDPRGANPHASWTANISNAALASRAGGGMTLVTFVRVRERTQGGTPRTIEVRGRDNRGNPVVRTLSGTGAASQKTIGNMLRSAHGLRSAQIDVLSPSPFVDTWNNDFPSHVYDIAQLSRMGLTTGCGDPTEYCPGRSVNRGEMAAFLHRTAGEPRPPRRHNYPDVSSSRYYDEAVSWLQAEQITDGYGKTGEYRPELAVTRGQMVTFLWRMAGEPRPAARHGFPDVSRARYYDLAVSWALEQGITDGFGETGRFEPDREVTRAQMASFLVRYVTAVH
jgi:SpoIID/LytB domain protein